MLIVNFDPFPVLTTERLVLRQANMEDVEEIFVLRSDPRILQYLDREPAKTKQDAIDFITLITDAVNENKGVSWNITLKGEDKTIGIISFWNLTKEHYRAETGYVLHPDYQGKGIMDEAMKAVLDYGFRVMKVHSIEANINPLNLPSQKVLERNGFVREAYFRENYYHNGVFTDSAIYSLLTPYR